MQFFNSQNANPRPNIPGISNVKSRKGSTFALGPLASLMMLMSSTLSQNVLAQSVVVTDQIVKAQNTTAYVNQAAYILLSQVADSDSDGYTEPPIMTNIGATGTPVAGSGNGAGSGGFIPNTSGAPLADGYGNQLGYCAFDNGSSRSATGLVAGAATPSVGNVAFAVISPGADGAFSTSCAQAYAGSPQGDDVMMTITQAQITLGTGGSASAYLWGTPAATVTALNALPTSALRLNEVRQVTANNMLYTWNGASWVTINSTASQLSTSRSISITGDAAWTTTFDGSANVTGALTLAASGVTAGSYGSATQIPTFVVDAKGRLTSVGSVAVPAAAWSTITGMPASISTFATNLNQNLRTTDAPTYAGLTSTGNISATGTINAGNITIAGSQVLTAAYAPFANAMNQNVRTTDSPTFAGGTFTGAVSATNFLQGGSQVLSAANFNSYVPTLSGVGATGTWGISVTGNAGTATKLATARTLSLTGDGTWTTTFDGSANATGALALVATGVTAGTYGSATQIPTFVVDAKGRLTSAGSVALPATAWSTITGVPASISTFATNMNQNVRTTDAPTFAGGTFTGPVSATNFLQNGSQVLSAANFNSYAPTLTGVGASGYWNINAATASTIAGAGQPANVDTYLNSGSFGWIPSSGGTIPFAGTYGTIFSFLNAGSTQDNTGNWLTQMGFSTSPGNAAFRNKTNNGGFTQWYTFAHSGNAPYAMAMNQNVRSTDAPTFAGGTFTAAVSAANFLQNGSQVLSAANSQYAYNMNQYVRTTDAPTFAGATFNGSTTASEVYSNGWFRNNAVGTGIYNQIMSRHIYMAARDRWVMTSGSGMEFRDDYEGGLRGYTFFNANGFGLLDEGGQWAVRINRASGNSGGSLAGTWDASNLTINGSQVLSAANFNSYAPGLTGANASGTWNISVTGNSNTVGGVSAAQIVSGNGSGTWGQRTTNISGDSAQGLSSGFYDGSGLANMPTNSWYHIINSAHVASGASTQYQFQIATEFWNKNDFFMRSIAPGSVGAWRKFLHDGNAPYALAMNQNVRTTDAPTFAGITSTGSISANGTVYASGTGGFASSTYVVGARNPIWRFGNADGYGLSYFQGTAGWGGQDTIGLHFGTPTAAGSPFQFRSDGGMSASGTVNAANMTIGGSQVLSAANFNSYAPSLTGAGASGNWNINITGGVLPYGYGANSVMTGRSERSGLYNYHTYGDANAPTFYGAAVGFGAGGSGSAEIMVNWVNNDGMWYRSLRDCCTNWSGWKQVLDSANAPYATNMNQNVRTTDAPTFAGGTFNGAVSATNYMQNGSQVLSAANFNSYAVNRNGDTVDGLFYFRSNKGANSYVSNSNSYTLQAFSSDGGAAAMSFHRDGAYAVNLGLDPDNVMRIGGWSAGANRWQLDMSGNNTVAGSLISQGGSVQIVDGNTNLTRGANYSTRVNTPYGWTEIGAQNSGWSHFQTNVGQFYFGSLIRAEGSIGIYNTGNYLDTAGLVIGNGRVIDNSRNITAASGTFTGTVNAGNITIGGSQVLSAANSPYANAMNQNVRTTDVPTFAGTTISSNGTIVFGPNSTWGASLVVGGNGRTDASKASVVTTNGNLHLDSANGFALYLNYYSNGGVYGPGGAAILTQNNFNTYAPTLTGGGASGTWGINVTGSAGSVPWSGITGVPASISTFATNMNQNVRTTDAPTFAGATFNGSTTASEVYSNGWFRNNAVGTGIYNQIMSRHLYMTARDRWVMTSGSGMEFRDSYEGSVRGFTYFDSAGFGLLDQGGSWAVRINRASGNAGGSLAGTWDASNLTINGSQVLSAANSSFAYNMNQNVRTTDAPTFASLFTSGSYGRTSASSGYLAGSYNNVGPNDSKSNPIYVIGTGYAPTDTALSNMYGMGYSHANFFGTAAGSEWGTYIAANGVIGAIITGGNTGRGWFRGDVTAGSFTTAGTVAAGNVTINGSQVLSVANSPYASAMNQFVRTTDTVSFAGLTVNGNSSTSGTASAGYVQINNVVTAGGACSSNGLVAKDASGLVLTCLSSIWTPSGNDCVGWGGDLNNLIIQAGTRSCVNGAVLGNAPTSDWFFVEVNRHTNGTNAYQVQTAKGMNGSAAGKVWVRSQQNGAVSSGGWGDWMLQGGSSRPWTSYFIGQSISESGVAISIGSNGYIYVGGGLFGTPGGNEPVAVNGSYIVQTGTNMYSTVLTTCKVYPTWTSDALRLRGEPPTSWASSGCYAYIVKPGEYGGGQ